MTTKLSLANLGKLPKSVAAPKYDRASLKPGIVHFGVGNFHRSHQAVYLDDLFNSGEGHDWAIVGAGVFEGEKAGREKLQEQDWLTTVVEQDAGHRQARVTGVMIDFLTPGDAADIIEQLADPAIRIVSLTITEGGYFIDPASGKFNPTHPDIVADAGNIGAPKTVFGLILAGLIKRRDDGIVPFTVMSCDNIPHNGHVTSDAVVGLALLIDEDLAGWVSDNVAFPNGMVDRITPATSDRERAILANEFGLEDNWPVFCEPFRQWVLEDKFTDGRPALEKVGVQFVDDVSPFELMKIRILNGGHAAIAYPSGLLDIHFVHEGMQEPLVSDFLNKVEQDEIIPTVPPVPGTDAAGLFRAGGAALLQPDDRRHDPQALPRRLEPAAEVHHPDYRRPAEGGQGHQRAGAGIGAVVPLLLRHDRYRRGDRAERPELGAHDGDGQGREGRPVGMARHERHLWRASASRRSSPRRLRATSRRCGRTARAPTVQRYLAGA